MSNSLDRRVVPGKLDAQLLLELLRGHIYAVLQLLRVLLDEKLIKEVNTCRKKRKYTYLDDKTYMVLLLRSCISACRLNDRKIDIFSIFCVYILKPVIVSIVVEFVEIFFALQLETTHYSPPVFTFNLSHRCHYHVSVQFTPLCRSRYKPAVLFILFSH